MDLRQGINGAADPSWSGVSVDRTVAFLEMVLEEWQDSRPEDKRMDDAIHQLIEATIDYAEEKRRDRRQP
jgi:hypothetical protein